MAYRKKAPATKSLSLTQQLAKVVNLSASKTPFQVHNALALLTQMKKHDEECFASFEKRAAVQNFIPSWIIKDGDLKKNASVYTLPLPKHYIDPSDSDEVLEHRKFYHESALKDSKSPPQTKYHPRCGLTGLFFSREEVVDNLQAAAYNLNFTSPFWIHSSHPSLESKYLKVKGGSESICIGLTSSVISVEDIEPFDHSLLHHTLHSKSLASAAKDAPAGMNAISGYVSENPFFKTLPLNGLWLTHDQVLANNLKINMKKKRKPGEGPLHLAETEQWELYNADQLVVPGRLGLRQCVPQPESSGIFEKV